MVVLAGYALYQGAGGMRDRRKSPSPAIAAIDNADRRFSVLMKVRIDSFDGLSPEAASRALGGTLVQVEDDTFTLLVDQTDRARDALELIDALDNAPSAHERLDHLATA
jgi:hypothetical protein